MEVSVDEEGLMIEGREIFAIIEIELDISKHKS